MLPYTFLLISNHLLYIKTTREHGTTRSYFIDEFYKFSVEGIQTDSSINNNFIKLNGNYIIKHLQTRRKDYNKFNLGYFLMCMSKFTCNESLFIRSLRKQRVTELYRRSMKEYFTKHEVLYKEGENNVSKRFMFYFRLSPSLVAKENLTFIISRNFPYNKTNFLDNKKYDYYKEDLKFLNIILFRCELERNHEYFSLFNFIIRSYTNSVYDSKNLFNKDFIQILLRFVNIFKRQSLMRYIYLRVEHNRVSLLILPASLYFLQEFFKTLKSFLKGKITDSFSSSNNDYFAGYNTLETYVKGVDHEGIKFCLDLFSKFYIQYHYIAIFYLIQICEIFVELPVVFHCMKNMILKKINDLYKTTKTKFPSELKNFDEELKYSFFIENMFFLCKGYEFIHKNIVILIFELHPRDGKRFFEPIKRILLLFSGIKTLYTMRLRIFPRSECRFLFEEYYEMIKS